MSPNNNSVTKTTTTSDQDSFNEMAISNVSWHQSMLEMFKVLIKFLQRKSKNVLNSFESSKDVNGNIVETKKNVEEEDKIEPAWFNIFGFIYLHFSLLQSYYIVHWNKTLAFGEDFYSMTTSKDYLSFLQT